MIELSALDSRLTVERLDSQGLLPRIEALPEQCEEAWRRAAAFGLPSDYAETNEAVLLGMGGSAIAGDLLRSLSLINGRKPVHVVRGYDLPPFVGPETLVIACSHSGNTEETLSAFEQALPSGARLMAITTGGRLLALATEHGVPALVYQYHGEPRSALGHQLMALLAISERLGLVGRHDESVAEAIALMRDQREALRYDVASARNPAKQLARRLHGRLPVIIGAGVLAEAAHRWKTQINENGKSWAIWEDLPELDHNAIVGFGLPLDVALQMRVVFLSQGVLPLRLALAYEATAGALSDAGVAHERFEAPGKSPLAVVLTAIHFGDFVSYYLGLLSGVEPSPVAPIQKFKQRLARGR